MTGSGLASGATEAGEMRLEVRTVNGRGLAVRLRLCPECAGFESAIEDAVKKHLVRGSVTVVAERAGSGFGMLRDRAGMRALVADLRALASDLGLPSELGLRDVVLLANTLQRGEAVTSRPLPPAFAKLLDAAIADLQRHREADGRGTAAAMRQQLAELERDTAAVAARAPAVIEAHRERLLKRTSEFVASQGLALEPADVVREVAFFAERVDVAEELQRLSAHTAAARSLLQQGGIVGRKLEFLLQELLRETNTLGAKSPDVQLAHLAVAMKTCIDRLKEQAANLE